MNAILAQFPKPLADALMSRKMTLAVMESCTGGLLSASISSTPGCGDYFNGGLVAYATDSKVRLGVEASLIDAFGVVSAETAAAMAQTAGEQLGANVSIGITGVAGPEPQDGEPVGRVFIAVAVDGKATSQQYDFGTPSPDDIKSAAVLEAFALLERRLLSETTK